MLKTLEQACTPRQSVFDSSTRDTVYDLADLDQINAPSFFEENFVTQGMQQLLTEAFKRLEGTSMSAAGAFLLSQSMGGGKTHNLIALGLLAKHPEMRAQVMGDFHTPGPLGTVETIAFTGRKTHLPYGIWGEIAEQLNRRDDFSDFYSPLRPPGTEDWVRLLRGRPTLIMLDELPPYFEAAQSTAVGATTLDRITTTALANLLVAVTSDKLPNVCLVLTDLRASVYSSGHAAMSEALSNLEQEANRSVQRIDPVRLNTDELYHILRTRLFEALPPEDDVEAVAQGFGDAVGEAQRMDLTVASPQEMRRQILDSYPFHPGIRDLYARFRENPGFQQTRALIRMMRMVVHDLWESGAAKQKYLVGAHDVDLNDSDMLSEIRQINSTLDNAVAHDIADEGEAVAEVLDGPERTDTQDAAKLIFLSSLSTAVDAVRGLDRSTIVQYLAAPGRSISGLQSALDALQGPGGAWYLHAISSGALIFRNTENLNAKLDSYAHGMLREAREIELRARLESMFEPQLKTCYQEVAPLPALDQVQLNQDRISLVIFRPSSEAVGTINTFWEQQQFKNRALFLTGTSTGYERVLDRAATLRAIGQIIGEFRGEGYREDNPQLREAIDKQRDEEGRFYMACREAFQRLYYPSGSGLTPLEIDLQYVANKFNGEEQIIKALEGVYKFRGDVSDTNQFRDRVEDRLWPQESKEVPWADIRRRAATDASWGWYHPRALDDLKADMLRQDRWRELTNGYVERGPFPKDPTSVTVLPLGAPDPDTGEVRLRVKPVNGDRVYKSTDGPASTSSEIFDHNQDFTTTDVKISFLAEDTSGEYQTGEPKLWQNSIQVKHKFYQDGDRIMCELQALPQGEIRYTVDGSNPGNSGHVYTEPFEVPTGARFVLARAEADSVLSQVRQWQPPELGETEDNRPLIDPQKPAVWKIRQEWSSTRDVYDALERAGDHRAELGGIRMMVTKDGTWIELVTETNLFQSPAAVQEQADLLSKALEAGKMGLIVDVMKFASGQDLLDMVAALKTTLDRDSVEQ